MTLKEFIDRLLRRQPASAGTAKNGFSWFWPTIEAISTLNCSNR